MNDMTIKFDGMTIGEYVGNLETQLTQQAQLLRKALMLTRSIIQAREAVCMMGSLAFMPVVREAQALIPHLEEAAARATED